jgi:hypothetical protein
MSKYHVTYLIPHSESAESAEAIEKNLDRIFGRKYHKLEGIDGVTVSFSENIIRTTRGAKYLLDNLKKVSSDLRIFIQPRDTSEDWLCHPERYKDQIEKVVDRYDAKGTTLKVLDILEN